MTSRLAVAFVLTMALLSLPASLAAQGPPIPLADWVRAADRIVIGVVVDVEPVLQESTFGHELIISHTTVQVEEVVKGPPNLDTLIVEVEGGTLGDVTLLVSDMEPVAPGDRGVFMVSQSATGASVALRGKGVRHLDPQNQVIGESWSLDDIRAAARAQGQNR